MARSDKFDNELVVTGAVFMALSSMPGCMPDLVKDEDGEPTNAVHLRFDFMKSRYKLTVEMDPEP